METRLVEVIEDIDLRLYILFPCISPGVRRGHDGMGHDGQVMTFGPDR